jgi:hypothetical protein
MSDDPRWGGDPRDRGDDDWRDRNDEDPLALGRGPGSAGPRDDHSEDNPRNRNGDARGFERDRDSRNRDESLDPRDVFMRDLDLPRGPDREIVNDARNREHTLRGSETRTLSTVGAFRVVSARDLRDHNERPADPRSGDLRHLREEGLIRTERLAGHRDVAVVLTKEGRDLLESNRRDDSLDHRQDHQHDHRQEFYADLKKPREVEHDSQVYRAYLREAERLAERGARIDRVELDYELKREYQQWLHERDRDRDDCDGRPDRDAHEVEEWAHDHDLPYFDDQVHFPDLRIEYQEPDGRWEHQDVEVTTVHYRGAHGRAAARSGFSSYRGSSARIGGGGGGRSSGGRSTLPRLAEEYLR